LRIAHLIERHGELFLTRVFTPAEIQFCSSRARASQYYASYWAGKETVVEVLGGWKPGLRWVDIEIRRDHLVTRVALGGVARKMFEDRNISELQLAVSHCRTHASAFLVAQEG
jgi:holo-[acyl-carrier protein] synthase